MQREGRASASEIARSLDVPVNSLAYHVKRLEQFGLIQQVQSVRRRGALMRVFETSPELERSVTALVDDHLVALAGLATSDDARVIVADLDRAAVAEFDAEVGSVRAKVRALQEATIARGRESLRSAPVVRVALIAVVAAEGDELGPQAS